MKNYKQPGYNNVDLIMLIFDLNILLKIHIHMQFCITYLIIQIKNGLFVT